MSHRTCQQDELYAAENAVQHQGRAFASVEEVQEYVDAMRDADWWERNFPEVARIEVHAWNKRTASAGGYAGEGLGSIPWWPAWRELYVIHEVCHALAGARFNSHAHDPWFARVYLEAVYTFIGPEAYAELRERMEHEHVDHNTDNLNPAGVQL